MVAKRNSKKETPAKKQKKSNGFFKKTRNTFIVIFSILFIAGCFALGVGAGFFASLVKDEPVRDYETMKQDLYDYEKTSKIYYAGENYYGDIRSDLHRERIKLDEVPEVLRQAVIATEDENFYSHNGIVPKAIVRATIQEVLNADTKTGGSTLTQQLIKNQILTNEVSFDRKAKEILLALRVDRQFSKEEILEAYLNVIPYGREASGQNIAGIKTASSGVFGVEAKDLNLAQSAYLAGLPQSPSVYTPFNQDGSVKDEEALASGMKRKNYVLNRMQEAGYISEKERDEAKKYDLLADFQDVSVIKDEKSPAFSDEIERRAKKIVFNTLLEKDGLKMADLKDDKELHLEYKEKADKALRHEGYRIYTTVDKDIQSAIETAATDFEHYAPDKPQKVLDDNGKEITVDEPVQTGGFMRENDTGKILGFVGSRGYSMEEQNNYATERVRSNGSTMKPILAFAPAIEKGTMQPGSVYASYAKEFDGHEMNNYGKESYGLVTARTALSKSYNVPTARIYSEIVDENPMQEYLVDIWGFEHLEKNDFVNISQAPTGQLRNGATLEETTNAYSTFGNEGEYAEGYMISKITTDNGDVVFEHEEKTVETFSPQTTYLMVDMLSDVLSDGTGSQVKSYLNNSSVDWVGKTGTSGEYKDALFIGVNPKVTVGIWNGYRNPKSLQCSSCSTSYSQRTQMLWADVVNAAAEVDPERITPTESFEKPDGIVTSTYCEVSGLAPSDLCSSAGLIGSDIFDKDHVPTKKDDSLVRGGSSVVVDGKTVAAGAKTPKEFVTGKGGLSFNPDFIERKGYNEISDLTLLYPRAKRDLWEKIGVSGASSGASSVSDPGKDPAAPSGLSLSGDTVSWNKAGGSAIIGYRLYRLNADGSVNYLTNTTETSYKIADPNAGYAIKTVDYFGRESGFSNKVKPKAKPPEEKEEDKEDKDDDKKDDKDKIKEKEKKEKEEKEKKEKEAKEKEKDKDKKDAEAEKKKKEEEQKKKDKLKEEEKKKADKKKEEELKAKEKKAEEEKAKKEKEKKDAEAEQKKKDEEQKEKEKLEKEKKDKAEKDAAEQKKKDEEAKKKNSAE